MAEEETNNGASKTTLTPSKRRGHLKPEDLAHAHT